jgi:ATP-dependent DNA ligase
MITPMKPRKVDRLPFGDNFIYEEKLDGGNCILIVKDASVCVRHGANPDNQNYKYPELISDIKSISPGIYHGELVVFNKLGFSDFKLFLKRANLTNNFQIPLRAKQYPICLVIHDILEANGENVRDLPLSSRKKLLEQQVKPNEHLKIIQYYKSPDLLLKQRQHIEGIVIKDLKSTYQEGKRVGFKVRFNKEKTVTCVDYEEHREGNGIVLITDDNKRINLAGPRSDFARKELNNNGKIEVEICYHEETDSGYRFGVVKRVKGGEK